MTQRPIGFHSADPVIDSVEGPPLTQFGDPSDIPRRV